MERPERPAQAGVFPADADQLGVLLVVSLHRERKTAQGFTLIELLVTLTIFALVFSALVAGLRSGTRAWRSVRRHQGRLAEETRAFRVIQEDLKHLAVVSEDIPALVEASEDEGSESLTITSLSPRFRQRAAAGSDWIQVQYTVDTDDAGASHLVRVAQPFVAFSPMRDAGAQEVLLSGVKGLRFDYGTPDGEVPAWEDPEKLPGSVTITIERDSGTSIAKSVWIPVGALGVGAQT